jgi:uncharacterized protein (DUF1778 family)
VYLAGLRIPDEDVRELIALVDEPTRSYENALALDSEVVALTIEDRERFLWALDDVRTEPSAELRGVLLQEQEWRARDGLVYPTTQPCLRTLDVTSSGARGGRQLFLPVTSP